MNPKNLRGKDDTSFYSIAIKLSLNWKGHMQFHSKVSGTKVLKSNLLMNFMFQMCEFYVALSSDYHHISQC